MAEYVGTCVIRADAGEPMWRTAILFLVAVLIVFLLSASQGDWLSITEATRMRWLRRTAPASTRPDSCARS